MRAVGKPINAPVIDATQASGVSMWDITVRPVANPSAPISGRVFTDYLAQITGGNGPTYRVESTLWAVTSDGFKYQVDLRGLDPNGYILYGNTVGFLNPDGVTPLYHDLVADINPLPNIEVCRALSADGPALIRPACRGPAVFDRPDAGGPHRQLDRVPGHGRRRERRPR